MIFPKMYQHTTNTRIGQINRLFRMVKVVQSHVTEKLVYLTFFKEKT